MSRATTWPAAVMAIAVCLLAVVPTANRAQAEVAERRFDFETADVPASVVAGRGSALTCTAERHRFGSQSLRWEWTVPSASISFQVPANLASRLQGCVFLWAYCETPRRECLRLELLSRSEVVGRCWWPLSFQGWRPLGVSCEMAGLKRGQAVDAIRFLAPASVTAGRMYLDALDLQHPTPPTDDDQHPWLPLGDEGLRQTPYCLDEHDLSVRRPYLPALKNAADLTAADRELLGKFTAAFQYSAADPRPRPGGVAQAEMERLRKTVRDDVRLRRSGDSVTGRNLQQIDENLAPLVRENGDLSLFAYFALIKQVGEAWRVATPEQAKELQAMFFDLLDHLLDQGYAAGNGQVGMLGHGYGWRNANFVAAILARKQELAESGRLLPVARALEWMSCGREIVRLQPTASTDSSLNGLRHGLAAAAAQPDSPEKLQRILAWRRALDMFVLHPLGTPGTGPYELGLITPDGGVIHHGGHHLAYASYSFGPFVDLHKRFNDLGLRTPLTPASIERFQAAARAMCWYTNQGDVPSNLQLRPALPFACDFPPEKRGLARGWEWPLWVARLGTPDGSQPVDRGMLACALAKNPPPNIAEIAALSPADRKPANLQGHYTFPVMSAAIHRRAGWMVCIRGTNRYWRGGEAYCAPFMPNSYCANFCQGSVFILSPGRDGRPSNLIDSGYRGEGYNYTLVPGATSHLGQETDITIARVLGYFGSGTTFGGGTNLDGNGVWGMKAFGNKSAFCFDRHVTLITTDIDARPKRDSAVVTGLYQVAMDAPGKEPSWINGQKHETLDGETALDATGPNWLIDPQHNGYYIHPGSGTPRVSRRSQQWRYYDAHFLDREQANAAAAASHQSWNSNRVPGAPNIATIKDIDHLKFFRPSQADFATAYLDHGPHAAQARCAWTIVLDATPQSMRQFAAAMADPRTAPHEILKQDRQAHVLRDRASGTVGYVLFEPTGELPAAGPLVSANRSCFVMIRPDGPRLRLSVAASDLLDKTPLVLVLRGPWQRAGAGESFAKVASIDRQTRLELPYKSYMPLNVVLESEAAASPDADAGK